MLEWISVAQMVGKKAEKRVDEMAVLMAVSLVTVMAVMKVEMMVRNRVA